VQNLRPLRRDHQGQRSQIFLQPLHSRASGRHQGFGPTIDVVAGHRHLVDALVAALFERDELVGDEITAVLAAARRRIPG